MTSLYRSSSDTAEYLLCTLEAIHQRVDLIRRRIDVEARPSRTRDVQRLHHDLAAVLSDPNRDSIVVENRAQIVRMNPVDVEGHHPAAVSRVVGPIHGDSREVPHRLERIRHQL